MECLKISLAGWVTLAQSFLMIIPTYAMQTTKIPKHTCKELERAAKKFVWGDAKETLKLSMTSWSKVQIAKFDDGLGLQSLYLINEAFYSKLCWNIMRSNNSLWIGIIWGKYKLNDVRVHDIKAPACSSVIWRYIGEN